VPGFLPLFTVEPFFRAEEGVRHRLRLEPGALGDVVDLLADIPPAADCMPAAILAAESLALAAIAGLCRAWSGEHPGPAVASPRMGAVLAVIDTIERRYAEPLRLGDLADAAGMAPSACCRLFRAVTGASPMEHLRRVRIRQAGVLLRSGLPLAEVAAGSGFCDAAHLARVFRRITGGSPGAWRNGGRPRRPAEA
jgi:transcriptional regulator GlxA family with amidase domain